ncbi:hypothetical protein BvCmsKSNP073_05305 [Escherichia coli]|nr:hypothetical protein BvCmsKSNP073_05305 [Escherichia coli]
MNEQNLRGLIFCHAHLILEEARFVEDHKCSCRMLRRKDNDAHHEVHLKNAPIQRSCLQNMGIDNLMTGSIHVLLDRWSQPLG